MKRLTSLSHRKDRKRKALEEADTTIDHKKSKILGAEPVPEAMDEEPQEQEETVNAEDIQHGLLGMEIV